MTKQRKIISILGRKHGFTLTEVIIVMALLVIMAAITIPNIISSLPDMRLKAAARDLYANMQKMRSLAVRDNACRAIVFSTVHGQYLLCADKGADDIWSTVGDNTVLGTVTLASYGSGVKYGHGSADRQANSDGSLFTDSFDNVSYNSNVLVFNPRGTGSAGYVYLDHQRNTTAYVVGTLSSGTTRLLRWSGNGWSM
jgi:prepilin-type N-terminal cleavage/methylation domain-containing protein